MIASNTRAPCRAGSETLDNSASGMIAACDRCATIVDDGWILLQPAAVFARLMDLSYKSRFSRNSATWPAESP
ncbi:MAG: hypothetical protein ACREYD_16410 [Casimicrobiaceae bacterium]